MLYSFCQFSRYFWRKKNSSKFHEININFAKTNQNWQKLLIIGKYMGPVLGQTLVNGWIHFHAPSGTSLPQNNLEYGVSFCSQSHSTITSNLQVDLFSSIARMHKSLANSSSHYWRKRCNNNQTKLYAISSRSSSVAGMRMSQGKQKSLSILTK